MGVVPDMFVGFCTWQKKVVSQVVVLCPWLSKGSNVVPFWACHGSWVRDYSLLPKKELHRRFWVTVSIDFCKLKSIADSGLRSSHGLPLYIAATARDN